MTVWLVRGILAIALPLVVIVYLGLMIRLFGIMAGF